ncbi:denticleless protein homolog [Sceloporus undulatus]|uniref:denticleless protein homolog n=1 Tax=Sceloporus undulatus TaxID=8520 RepID=UPI001C4B4FCE|nr:denticleless protein homolog [Sceloporus undulatus]
MLCRSLLRRCRDGPQGLPARISVQHLLKGYCCAIEDDFPSYGEIGLPVPPFGCTFSTASGAQHILAVANEEGIVRLYDTHTQKTYRKVFGEWQAHSNAVFDLAWMPKEHTIVTASGDQTAKLWDAMTEELLGVCKGHQCSLKSVAFSKFEKAVFCTGGRDGNIMVWDVRCNKKDGFYRQVKQISGAHNVTDKQTPSNLKKKKQSVRGLAPSVDFQQSVTVVLLQDEHTLISAGAVDGVIKVWDLRKNYTTYRQDPLPSRSFGYPGNSTRKLGYSSLVLDSTGTSLFANCTDDNIYMFSMSSFKTTPVSVFSGHQNSSFYVKSSISPDDQFLLSGSSNTHPCIWKVSEPHLPPIMLHGHGLEVTSVAWCPSDFSKISTCSDDNTVKIWRFNRRCVEADWRIKKSLVGWTYQKKMQGQNGTGTLWRRHSTPVKVLPAGSPSISSPQLAVCAPAYTGDLPFPTNTPTWSSDNTPTFTTSTSAPAKQQMEGTSPKPAPSSAMSIRQWVTKTPSSSPPVKGVKVLSPQKELSGATFASKSSHLRSEVRAKRRLESSKEVNAKCLKSCNCVAELHPVSKKPRLEQDTLADSKPCEGNCLTLGGSAQATESLMKEPLPSPGSPGSSAGFQNLSRLKSSCDEMADKENGCPDKRNWLSALGYKLQTNKSKSPNGTCSRNQLFQNLDSKQQESRTGGPISATSVPMRKICTYFERKSQKN